MMVKIGHKPIRMHRVLSSHFICRRGDFYWDVRGDKRTLVVAIPRAKDDSLQYQCTHHETVYEPFQYSRWSIEHPNASGASWSWNGNIDEPTLIPSLHAVDVWHGYVIDGELVEA